jgi:hypothetical protein
MLLSRHSIPRHGLGCSQQAAAGSNTRTLHAAALRRQGGRHHETAARVAQIDKMDVQVPEIGGDSEDAAYCGSEGTYLSIQRCNTLVCSSRRVLKAQPQLTSFILSSQTHVSGLRPAPCQNLLWSPSAVTVCCRTQHCCMPAPPPAGSVLVREAPADIPKNGKRYHIHTFGCQMNLADSERMAGVLESVGYECSEDPAAADVLIYNTCSIREKAEMKVYSALGRMVGGTSTGTHCSIHTAACGGSPAALGSVVGGNVWVMHSSGVAGMPRHVHCSGSSCTAQSRALSSPASHCTHCSWRWEGWWVTRLHTGHTGQRTTGAGMLSCMCSAACGGSPAHGTALLLQAKRKRDNVGDVKIVVAGCVAQQEGQQLLRRVPELDVVMGPQFANKINQLLEQVEQGSQVGAARSLAAHIRDMCCQQSRASKRPVGWAPSR